MPIVLVGDSLADLERQIEALKQMGFAAAPPNPQQELERKVKKLKQRATRTTGKVWDLVFAAANLPQGQEFSLADLATAMNEQLKSVKSWHRILGRPLKRLQLTVFARVPGTANPAKFVVPPDVRQAVLSA